jgi:hypothetical protein
VWPGTAGPAKELLRLGDENAAKLGQLLAFFSRRNPGGRPELGRLTESRGDATSRVHQRRERAILRMNLLFKTRHSGFRHVHL